MRQWTEKYVDFMHFTVPLTVGSADGYTFPSEFSGQFGVYEAVAHLFKNSSKHANLVKEETLLANKKYFARDSEEAIDEARKRFRE